MGQSGSKLVVTLGCLALALGAASWWYRFESAHRATQFWGSEAAALIVVPGQVEALILQPQNGRTEGEKLPQLDDHLIVSQTDLSDARGLVHLRHALVTDTNYLWNETAIAPVPWRWALRFQEADDSVLVLFSADLATLGKLTSDSPTVDVISCQPMAETLQQYFADLGLN